MMAEVQRKPGGVCHRLRPWRGVLLTLRFPKRLGSYPPILKSLQSATKAAVTKYGNSSSLLTQYDIEEVQEHCKHTFSQQKIVSLYNRFCQLDRNGKGFISGDEFMSVPEFAVNPLSQIAEDVGWVDGLNFKEFVAFLSAFSSRANLQQKVDFIFKCYDYDSNGKVSFSEILDVLLDLTGQFIYEEQREEVLAQVLEEAGYTRDSLLVPADFVKANFDLKMGDLDICQRILGTSSLKMEVEVPVD